MAITDIEFQICQVDVAAAYQLAGRLTEPFPRRAPAVVAQALRPYIKGRIVCDLGCGAGDLAWLMSHYAAKAIAIEVDYTRGRYAQARAAASEHMEFFSLDYFQQPIPQADLYYAWPDDPDSFAAIAKRLRDTHSPCTLAAGGGVEFFESERKPAIESVENRLGSGRRSHVLSLVEKFGGKVVTFPFREDSARREWSGVGNWALALITL